MLVELGDRWPSCVGEKVVGGSLLVDPAWPGELQVDVERDLKEADKGAVKLLDVGQWRDARNLDLAVEAEAWVGSGLAVAVGRRLHRDQLAMVAELHAGERDARSGTADLGAVRHVDHPARTPRPLDRRSEVRNHGVEALDEAPGL